MLKRVLDEPEIRDCRDDPPDPTPNASGRPRRSRWQFLTNEESSIASTSSLVRGRRSCSCLGDSHNAALLSALERGIGLGEYLVGGRELVESFCAKEATPKAPGLYRHRVVSHQIPVPIAETDLEKLLGDDAAGGLARIRSSGNLRPINTSSSRDPVSGRAMRSSRVTGTRSRSSASGPTATRQTTTSSTRSPGSRTGRRSRRRFGTRRWLRRRATTKQRRNKCGGSGVPRMTNGRSHGALRDAPAC